ncbi:MAG TPA: hypothetical protein DCY88_26845 [Cyanobacteria bacterium UBA11372]|nr:hypothetical protein [Cyanobacteria bacterium UBA11372]HBE36911.1 hypothetical protein [Cyanobacteria bacterium UBA11368]HBE51766.1 hypothetical protein [Cyanobacteria bacterium UBA11369]
MPEAICRLKAPLSARCCISLHKQTSVPPITQTEQEKTYVKREKKPQHQRSKQLGEADMPGGTLARSPLGESHLRQIDVEFRANPQKLANLIKCFLIASIQR